MAPSLAESTHILIHSMISSKLTGREKDVKDEEIATIAKSSTRRGPGGLWIKGYTCRSTSDEDACHRRETRLRDEKGLESRNGWFRSGARGAVRIPKPVAECKWIYWRDCRLTARPAGGRGSQRGWRLQDRGCKCPGGHAFESSSPRRSRQPVQLNNFNCAASWGFLVFDQDVLSRSNLSIRITINMVPNHCFPYICGEVSPRQH
jgi:hypothetical protein